MSGVARIAEAFRAARGRNRVALIPYFVAGYPSLRATARHLRDAVEAGVDAIELGIPFSDPVADGPTLQAAIVKSLEAGTRPADALALVKDLRADGIDLPILAMTYANILNAPGFDAFARLLGRAGVDGAIVPDIPADEPGEYWGAMRSRLLATVFLASPSTEAGRLRAVLRASSGFVYLVAAYGTTGARRAVAPEAGRLLARVRALRSSLPACVGFGVSKPGHVGRLKRQGADGVIVGSALVDEIRKGRSPSLLLKRLVAAA